MLNMCCVTCAHNSVFSADFNYVLLNNNFYFRFSYLASVSLSPFAVGCDGSHMVDTSRSKRS